MVSVMVVELANLSCSCDDCVNETQNCETRTPPSQPESLSLAPLGGVGENPGKEVVRTADRADCVDWGFFFFNQALRIVIRVKHWLEIWLSLYLGLGLWLYSFKSNHHQPANPQWCSGTCIGDGLQIWCSGIESSSVILEFFFLNYWRDLDFHEHFIKQKFHVRNVLWELLRGKYTINLEHGDQC